MKKVFLKHWQEAVGELSEFKVSYETASIILSIKSSNIVIEIPVNMLKCDFNNLKKIRGKRVGILRTDKGYYLSEIQMRVPSSDKMIVLRPLRAAKEVS